MKDEEERFEERFEDDILEINLFRKEQDLSYLSPLNECPSGESQLKCQLRAQEKIF